MLNEFYDNLVVAVAVVVVTLFFFYFSVCMQFEVETGKVLI